MCADAPHKDTLNSEGKNTNPEQQQPEIPPPLRAELQIPPSAINAYQSDQGKKYGLERWKFFVEILTLVAIIVYAIITYCQWTTMREATEATQKSANAATDTAQVAKDTLAMQKDSVDKTLSEMKAQSEAMKTSVAAAKESNAIIIAANRLDRRAWIGITEISRVSDPKPNGKLIFNILLQNSGKTPALKVIVKKGFSFDYPTVDKLDPKIPEISKISKFAMAPATGFSSPIESNPLSENEVQKIINKTPVYVYGTIQYVDVEGIDRKTTFCAQSIYKTLGDPFLTFCSEFNDIK